MHSERRRLFFNIGSRPSPVAPPIAEAISAPSLEIDGSMLIALPVPGEAHASDEVGGGAIRRLRAFLMGKWMRIEPVAVWVIYVEWAAWVSFLVISFFSAVSTDSTADLLAASAAAEGASPFADLRDLSDRFGIPFITPAWSEVGGEMWTHPRPPAALLLLQPVIQLSPLLLHGALVIVSVALLGIVARFQMSHLMERRWALAVLLASALLVSGPVLRSLQFGAWSVVLAALVGATWVAHRRGRDYAAGLFLGLLIGIRLFPALLVIPLLAARRPRPVVIALSSALLLNVVGMIALSIPPAEMIQGLGLAGDTWVSIGGNGSLVKPLTQALGLPPSMWVVGLAALFAAYTWRLARRGASFDQLMAIAIVAMLLISPLSWEHYDVMLFLVIAWMLRPESPKPARVGAALWIVAMTVGFVARQPWEQVGLLAAGPPSLLGRVLLLVLLVGMAETRARRSNERVESPRLSEQPSQ